MESQLEDELGIKWDQTDAVYWTYDLSHYINAQSCL